MDIETTVRSLPGAEPFDGLPESWRWSPAPGIDILLALSADRGHAFRFNARDSFDADLATAVLAFAREHSGAILGSRGFLIPIAGFSHPGRSHDTVVAVPPSVHTHWASEKPELRGVTYGVFPAYRFEVAGTETKQEATARLNHQLRPANLGREPFPYVKMRYENPKTQAGSIGKKRKFGAVETLTREIGLLDGVPDGFVEFENVAGRVWTVRWADGQWLVSGGDDLRLGESEAVAWAESRLIDVDAR